MGFLRLLRPWGFSHEARRGPQGASRAAPGKSGLYAHGEGELVITLESWEAARSSRGVEEGLSRSFSGCGGKPSFPSTSAGDLTEIPRVPLRGEGCCGVGRASRDSAGFGAMEEGLTTLIYVEWTVSGEPPNLRHGCPAMTILLTLVG